MPEYCIRLDGESPVRDLRQLAQWLRQNPAIRTRAAITLQPAPTAEGEMGGAALDVIALVTETGFSAANLVLAISAWRRTRPSTPGVTIERDGVRVTVDSGDPAEIARLTRALDSE
ncbi:hypothetical protein GCM10010302_06000 [Streptomyces polychromogenes]|uniref:Uncharacterized protein n=1 Tax=Streptomyces polychromogenes TaxID=67342 RepID=A0ABP3ENC7_9ACTN